MNQDTATADWNLDLAERIARIVGLDSLARHDVMVLDPGAIGRDPFRIKDDLLRETKTARQRKLFSANSDLIDLHLFVALPKRELKRGDVYREVNIALARLQTDRKSTRLNS